MQVVLVYLQPFHWDSVLKCVLHPKLWKIHKTLFLGGSRSLMLINLKSLLLLLVITSRMFIPISNHFHTIRANNNKITSFTGYPSLMPSFKRNPCTQGHEILSQKARDLEAAHSKDFMILGVAILIQCQGVTDEQTNGQTDKQMPRPWLKTREAFCYRR